MKSLIAPLITATAISSHLAWASPFPLPPLNAINTTLASWGIVQVEDWGLLNGDVPEVNLTTRANAVATFQAFSGDHCDTGGGTVLTVYDTGTLCSRTIDRHSFRITGGTCYVSADPTTACSNKDGSYIPGGKAAAGCYNVNTGQNWQSSFIYYTP